GLHLARGLLAAHAGHGAHALLELGRAQRQVLGDVVDDLRAGVGGHARPLLALRRGLHGVTHVLAVRERRLAHALAGRAQDRVAVVGVGALLHAAQVDLRRPVHARAVALGRRALA